MQNTSTKLNLCTLKHYLNTVSMLANKVFDFLNFMAASAGLY